MNEEHVKRLEERSRRGRYLVVNCADVGVPYESALVGGLGSRFPEDLTHSQDIAGGMSLLRERGWRFLCTIGGTSNLMVFERDEDSYDSVLASLKAMHRRAQKNEGAAAREQRLRDGFAKERAMLVGNARFWENRARAAEAMMASNAKNRPLLEKLVEVVACRFRHRLGK